MFLPSPRHHATSSGEARTIGDHIRSLHVAEREFSGERSGLVCCESHGDYASRIAGEELALIAYAIEGVANGLHTTL